MEFRYRPVRIHLNATQGHTVHLPASEQCYALHIREPYLDLDRRGWRREVYVQGKCAGEHKRTNTSVQNVLLPTVAMNLELAATTPAAIQSKL